MLAIFTRHRVKCLKALKAKKLSAEELRDYRRCQCPKYFSGTYEGKWYPRTGLDACTWEAAERALDRIKQRATGTAPEVKPEPAATLITDAVRSWVIECRTDGLRGMRTWEHLGEILLARARQAGIKYVHQITPVFINAWRASWMIEQSPRKPEPGLKLNTRESRRRRLSHFLSHCVRMQYITENPMRLIKPKGRRKKVRVIGPDGVAQRLDIATMPLDEEGDANYRRVLAAIPAFFAPKRIGNQIIVRRAALGSRPDNFAALLDLMYTTGLRISDSLLFEIDRVCPLGGGWGSYTTVQYKTGDDVTVAIEPGLLARMRLLPRIAPRYLFWDGRTPIERYECNQVGEYLRSLGRKFGIPKLHAHRFRDSFAVNKLNEGWRMQDVSRALGHKSIAITEMYYARWVRSREKALIDNWINMSTSFPSSVPEASKARPN